MVQVALKALVSVGQRVYIVSNIVDMNH